MAKNQRTFQDGLNEMNGYQIMVTRFVGAYQNGDNSRIAAHYWGSITHPNGDITFMGDNGMTVTEIKRIIGGATRSYNRGESSELKKLEGIKAQMEALGIDTTDVEAKIEAEKARDEQRKANLSKIKVLEKEIKELNKLKSSAVSLGIVSATIEQKIAEKESELVLLTE